MNKVLTVGLLAGVGAQFAVLGVGRYALPVRFRIRGESVECRVPAWSGMGDLLEGSAEATLVACVEHELCLRWLFIRGPIALVPAPDWEGLQPPQGDPLLFSDLYQILRLSPQRIELVDERQGWGYRETADRHL